MYYKECEALAFNNPTLKDLITIIDGRLKEIEGGHIIDPSMWARLCSAKESQVTGVLGELSETPLIEKAVLAECKKCESKFDYELMESDPEDFECPNCGVPLSPRDIRVLRVYKKNVDALKLNNKDTADFKEREPIPPEPLGPGFDEPLPPELVKDPFCYTHLLRYYPNNSILSASRPFSNKRFLILLHLLRDIIPFIEAAISIGLDPDNSIIFYKAYGYPQRKAIAEWLENKGFDVKPVSQIAPFLKYLSDSDPGKIGEIIIVEDGGLITPRILNEFGKLRNNVLGAVEQTTRGINNIRNWERQSTGNTITFPILSVAESTLKSKLEPDFIAKAVVRNIENLLSFEALAGKRVAVLGCGKIGQAIINWLRANNAVVTAYDTASENLAWARTHGATVASTAPLAVSGNSLIIGASGYTSIDRLTISNLSHGTYLVSASSEQYEIDVEELEARKISSEDYVIGGRWVGKKFLLPPNRREVFLLANGYPINFWGMNSMPEQISDPILSQIFLASAEIALGNYTTPGIDSDYVNVLSSEQAYDVAGEFLHTYNR